MVYWHSLAKLRLHTDSSLRELRQVTVLLGEALRYFADETCQHFKTFETDKEYQARSRATTQRLVKVSRTSGPLGPSSNNSKLETNLNPLPPMPAVLPQTLPHSSQDVIRFEKSEKRPKVFNTSTPKAHFFPDYPEQIERHGTTDSLSTKLGESRPSQLKGQNDHTNYNNATPQIIGIDVREAVHARMTEELLALEKEDETPVVEHLDIEEHFKGVYRITAEERPSNREFLPEFLDKHRRDPALTNYIPRLKAHLLARKRGLTFTGEQPTFSERELCTVIIRDNFLYSHATAAFYFTTYDLCRDQDSMNTNSGRSDIMIPCFETPSESDAAGHPYWWFGCDMEWESGPSTLRLDRIGFIPSNNKEAFGFLDPSLVVRMCHLVPAFKFQKTVGLLGPSLARDSEEGDWENYYVMRFADRDMMMCYLGTGIGHQQPTDFPRDIGRVKRHLKGGFYKDLQCGPTASATTYIHQEDGTESDSTFCSDDKGFVENIYEP